jgi:hypothetical protein
MKTCESLKKKKEQITLIIMSWEKKSFLHSKPTLNPKSFKKKSFINHPSWKQEEKKTHPKPLLH